MANISSVNLCSNIFPCSSIRGLTDQSSRSIVKSVSSSSESIMTINRYGSSEQKNNTSQKNGIEFANVIEKYSVLNSSYESDVKLVSGWLDLVLNVFNQSHSPFLIQKLNKIGNKVNPEYDAKTLLYSNHYADDKYTPDRKVSIFKSLRWQYSTGQITLNEKIEKTVTCKVGNCGERCDFLYQHIINNGLKDRIEYMTYNHENHCFLRYTSDKLVWIIDPSIGLYQIENTRNADRFMFGNSYSVHKYSERIKQEILQNKKAFELSSERTC